MQEDLILALVTGFDTDIDVTGVVVVVLLILWICIAGLVDLTRRGGGSQVPLTSQLFLSFLVKIVNLYLLS